MIGLNPSNVFLALGATDMRKAINGLSLLAHHCSMGDPLSGAFFAFCNRHQTIVKVLYWDHNGFCLWQKKLDKDRFKWPKTKAEVMEINTTQLTWLLAGLDIHQAHQKLQFTRVN